MKNTRRNENIAAMLNKAAEVKLEDYILIAIPTTIKDQEADREIVDHWVETFGRLFTKYFGGYRCNEFMKGGFYDWTLNKRVDENNVDIWSRCKEEDLEENLPNILDAVHCMKIYMKQTAIYVEVKNGEDVAGYYI